MKQPLKIILFAYPENPVASLFIQTFQNHRIPIHSILIKNQQSKKKWKRFIIKIKKDGFRSAVQRILQIWQLTCLGRTIVQVAEKHQIPVHWVEKFNSEPCENWLQKEQPDLLVIVSAPILKENIFKKARIGCLNPHPGWLPAYRGIGANAYALKNGDMPGITVHFIDKEVDQGRIIFREKLNVKKGDTIAKINDRAMTRGAGLIIKAIQDIENDRLQIPEINEIPGPIYRAMPFREARRVNHQLKRGWIVDDSRTST